MNNQNRINIGDIIKLNSDNREYKVHNRYIDRDSDENIKLSFMELKDIDGSIEKYIYEPDMGDCQSCDYDFYDKLMDNDILYIKKNNE